MILYAAHGTFQTVIFHIQQTSVEYFKKSILILENVEVHRENEHSTMCVPIATPMFQQQKGKFMQNIGNDNVLSVKQHHAGKCC